MQKIIHSPQSEALIRLLRRLRKKAGYTQEELAMKLGLKSQTISAIERGERMILLLEVWEYLKPLGVKPSEFVEMLEKQMRRIKE